MVYVNVLSEISGEKYEAHLHAIEPYGSNHHWVDLWGVNNLQKNLAKYFVLEGIYLGDMYEYSKFNFINALGYLTCV